MKETTIKTKKRILLTGASGTVGFETLKHLVKNPEYQITAFDVESPSSVKKLAPFRNIVDIVYGDITSSKDIATVSRNKDFTIHLAAIIPPLADIDPELAHRVNVQGTKNLIDALEKNSPHCYLIFSSSISVYGDRINKPEIVVSDELKPSPGDRYGETKVLCEKMIRQSNLPWSIFRLAAIMGNHKISKLMFHMPLETPMEICTPEDTGRAFANAIDFQDQLENRIFNLGGGEDCVISYRAFLDRMFDAFGLGKVDFPEKAFAEKNFHCGIMQDGYILEDIIRFRRENLIDYFETVKQNINPYHKKITFLLRNMIKRWLLSQSEPYKAFRKGNISEIEHFFNKDKSGWIEPSF